MTTRRTLLTGMVGLGALAAGGCSSSDRTAAGPAGARAGVSQPSASADPVAVRAVLGGPVTIGLVVSLTSGAGEGRSWAAGSEGAHVAVRRLRRGDAQVDVVAANDKGTAEGIVAAVQDLADKGVAGIVVASAGTHLRAALAPAAKRGIPLVLCHPVSGTLLRENVWCTAPLTEHLDAALVRAAGSGSVLVDAGGGTPSGLAPRVTLRSGAAGLDAASMKHLRTLPQETVVVTGDADALAAVAAALQTVAHQGRVLLGPEATSRRFAKALLERQASLGQDLVTVGLPTDDPMAMTAGEQGQAVTNFLAGVRDASTSQMTSFFDGAPFSEVAWAADAASHDAVIALVGGAAMAASSDPRRVAEKLAGLRLGHRDGLVTAAVDLTRRGAGVDRAAVDASEVVVLRSTQQDPGLRPADPSAAGGLFWFADS